MSSVLACWLPTGWRDSAGRWPRLQRHCSGDGANGRHATHSSIRLAPPLGDVLEAEGLVLEPIGAVLALLLLELVLGDLHGWRAWCSVCCLAGRWCPDRRQRGMGVVGIAAAFEPDQATGLPLQLSLGMLFLMYGFRMASSESGLPASVAAGIGGATACSRLRLDDLIQQLAQRPSQ